MEVTLGDMGVTPGDMGVALGDMGVMLGDMGVSEWGHGDDAWVPSTFQCLPVLPVYPTFSPRHRKGPLASTISKSVTPSVK